MINENYPCPEGWSSTGDFTSPKGGTCDQHIISIRVLGIICAILNVLAFVYVIRILSYRVAKGSVNLIGWFHFSFYSSPFLILGFITSKFVGIFSPKSKLYLENWLNKRSGEIQINAESKINIPSQFAFCTAGFAVYGILKAINPSTHGIGLDYLTTVIDAIAMENALSAMFSVNIDLLGFCLKQLELLPDSEKVVKSLASIQYFASQ